MSKTEIPKQKRLVAIDVFESSIVATVFQGRRPVRKLITPADAITLFSAPSFHDSAVNWLESGRGVVRSGIRQNGHVVVHWVRPAKMTKITCQIGKRNHRFKVRMPNLLAVLSRMPSGWTAIEHVFAFSGKLRRSTKLYVPPLPNMYGDGSVCMGSVELQAGTNTSAAEFFETDFIGSLFSDHLADTPLIEKSGYKNVVDALRKTKGNVPLTALKKVTTYGELIRN